MSTVVDVSGKTRFNEGPNLHAICKVVALKPDFLKDHAASLAMAAGEGTIERFLTKIEPLLVLAAAGDNWDWSSLVYRHIQVLVLQVASVSVRFNLNAEVEGNIVGVFDSFLLEAVRMLFVFRCSSKKWLVRHQQRRRQLERHMFNLLWCCRLDTRHGNRSMVLPFDNTAFKTINVGGRKGLRGRNAVSAWLSFLLDNKYIVFGKHRCPVLEHDCSEDELNIHRSLWAKRMYVSGDFLEVTLEDSSYVLADCENAGKDLPKPFLFHISAGLKAAFIAAARSIQAALPPISLLLFPNRCPKSLINCEKLNFLIHKSFESLRLWCKSYEQPENTPSDVPTVSQEFSDLMSLQTIGEYPRFNESRFHDRLSVVTGKRSGGRKYDKLPVNQRSSDAGNDWNCRQTHDPNRKIARAVNIGMGSTDDGNVFRVTSSDLVVSGWSLLGPLMLYSNIFATGVFFHRLLLGDGSVELLQSIEDLESLFLNELENARVSRGPTLESLPRDLSQTPWGEPFYELCSLHNQIMELVTKIEPQTFYHSCYSFHAQVLSSSFLLACLPIVIGKAREESRDRFQLTANLSGIASLTSAFDSEGQPAEVTIVLPDEGQTPCEINVPVMSQLAALTSRNTLLDAESSKVPYCRKSVCFDTLAKEFEAFFTAPSHSCGDASIELFETAAKCAKCFPQSPMTLFYQHHSQYHSPDIKDLERMLSMSGIAVALTDIFGPHGRFTLESFEPLLFSASGALRRQSLQVKRNKSEYRICFKSSNDCPNATLCLMAASAGLQLLKYYEGHSSMITHIRSVFKAAVRSMAMMARLSELRENIGGKYEDLNRFLGRYSKMSNITGPRTSDNIVCSMFKSLDSRLGYFLPRSHHLFTMLSRRFDIEYIKRGFLFDRIKDSVDLHSSLDGGSVNEFGEVPQSPGPNVDVTQVLEVPLSGEKSSSAGTRDASDVGVRDSSQVENDGGIGKASGIYMFLFLIRMFYIVVSLC